MERQLHKEARDRYILAEKNQVIIDDNFEGVNRNLIKKIKRDLVFKDPKYEELRSKYKRLENNEDMDLIADEKLIKSPSKSDQTFDIMH
jgi:23S rRNA A2030 N6-methylase RlmJ